MKDRPLWPLLLPATALVMMVAFVAITHWLDRPETVCGLRKTTGLYCPGCGGTRCANNIMHGHLLTAFSNNAMLMTSFVFFMFGSVYLIIRMTILGKPAPKMPEVRASWIWMTIGGILLFTVLRNIPAWPFSLLAP